MDSVAASTSPTKEGGMDVDNGVEWMDYEKGNDREEGAQGPTFFSYEQLSQDCGWHGSTNGTRKIPVQREEHY